MKASRLTHRERPSRRRPLRFESCESRQLMAADIVISEVVASNQYSLLDKDFESPDWIELHNRSSDPIHLHRWFLTDDPRDLTKWQFPDITLAPDAFQIVFASGKDRLTGPSEPHTNFRLEADGEYLALVRPDGMTIADSIAPAYPGQSVDISFGRGMPTKTTVVGDATLHRYWIPEDGRYDSREDGAPAWTAPPFDDSNWSTGMPGFGYDRSPAETVTFLPFSIELEGTATTIAGRPAHLTNQSAPYLTPLPITATTVHSAAQGDSGSWLSSAPGTLRMDLVFPATLDHILVWNYSSFDSSQEKDLHQERGTREFAVSFSTDGLQYTPEQTFTLATPVVGDPVPLQQFFVGPQTARYVRFRQITSYAESFFGLGEIAFSRGEVSNPAWVYDSDYVTTNVSAAMTPADRNSLYLRSSFSVASPDSVTKLALQMRYDDGFVAYLNGVEVARAHAPQAQAWDSSATASQSNASAVEFREFDLTAHRSLLRPSNVLAIQVLNHASDRGDLLLHPRLQIQAADPVTFGYLQTPTPGSANSLRVGAPVTFSQAGGILRQPLSVALSVDNPHDVIRYTLDGKDPNETSAIYVGPISINESTQVIARAYTPSGQAGPTRREAYLKLDADIQDFSSNLPIFVIDSFGGPISLGGALRSTYSVVFDTQGEAPRASLGNAPQYAGRSGLRQRGRSSGGFLQKQYKYEIWDQSGGDLDVPLVGLPSESDWVLNGPYTDNSLMRNAVAYQWWRNLGHYAPRTRFVEVFLNIDGDRQVSYKDDYVGVYVLTESIKQSPERVDIQPPENTTNLDEITGGYIIEAGNPGQFSTRTSGRNVGYQFEDPGPADLNSVQQAWIKRYLEEFETALYSPTFRHPETGKHYSEYIDVDSWVDYRILREFTKNFDGGSTYLYIDRGGQLTMGPAWDYNWALGNVNYEEPATVDRCGCHIRGWNYSYTTPTIAEWPAWSVRMQQDVDFWQKVVDRWSHLRGSVLKDNNYLADIESNYRLLSTEAAARNFKKWPTLGRFTVISPPGYQQRDTYDKEVAYLKDWLVKHAAWLDEQFLPSPRLSHQDGPVPTGQPIEIASAPAPRGRRLIAPGAPARYRIPTDNSLADSWTQVDFPAADTWSMGNTGLGFDNSNGYTTIIGRNIATEMARSRSALLRLEFLFEDIPDALLALKLNMRYDDGFVAYLNGIEVARSQSVTNPTPGTARATAHEAYDSESFDLTSFKHLLRTGRNVLALHGINTNLTSTDFVILPELVAEWTSEIPRGLVAYYTNDGSDPRAPGGGIAPSARIVHGPIRIDRSQTIRTRVLQDSAWSPLAQATYLVETVSAGPGNLRIVELHYNPADARTALGELERENDEFEFIEFLNTGNQTIDLTNVRLTETVSGQGTEGVLFTFPTLALPPGERTVVVENIPVFQSRYRYPVPIAGQYTGRLADAGERIQVVAASGAIIQSFQYGTATPWPAAPQGFGPTLQIINPQGDYDSPGNWRASGPDDGTPGRREYTPGDSNLDGIFDSRDLVLVFQAGQYEDAIAENAGWLEGDWNGDREFTSSDLVAAFQYGDYAAALLPDQGVLADIALAVQRRPMQARPAMANERR